MGNTFPYASEPTHVTGTGTTGSRDSGTYGSSYENRLVVDASDEIAMLSPRKNPLMALFTNVGKT